MKTSGFKDMWTQRKARTEALKEAGGCRIERYKGRLQVVCPNNDTFTLRSLELGGRYRKRTGVWSFPAYSYRLLHALCVELWPGKVSVQ